MGIVECLDEGGRHVDQHVRLQGIKFMAGYFRFWNLQTSSPIVSTVDLKRIAKGPMPSVK